MNYFSPHQVFEVLVSDDYRYVTPLSDTSFRLSQRVEAMSHCIEGLKEYQGHIKVDNSSISFGGLEIRSTQEGLEVYFNGHKVVDFSSLTPKRETLDLSLAEKEGHAHYVDGEYAGGFSIFNDRPVYGLGERTGPLDKRGYDYINWNTDDPSAHVDTFKSLYQSIPFFILFDGDHSVGVYLDNSSKARFDFNKTAKDRVSVFYESGDEDLYFFFGSLDHVIAEYTALTGRSSLVPYWALGNQQSRWSYPDKATVERVIQGYKDVGIPLSVVYLDIDYMDAYKDFTVDEHKFPNISSWLSALKEEDLRIVPIIDAGVKAEEGYFLYDEGMEQGYFSTLDGRFYHNEVWPGDSVFPAFVDPNVRNWWANHVKSFLDLGFSGIWNDMNEPASFKGPLPLDVDMGGLPHSKAHNVYGHFMVQAGAQGFALARRRLFQLTRAGYAGTCRYSASWTGDNQSIYDHLRLSIPQLLNMSLSGQNYVGVDIGGFSGDMTPELLCRFATAAIFNPLYRNHAALGTLDQEPYHLEGIYLEAYRNAVMKRYELLPTLYDQMYLGEVEGSIALKPLVYNYPSDSRTYNENTALMLGKDLLLAPALFPGQQCRAVYFPEDFVHMDTGEEYPKGDRLVSVGLTDIPLFIRREGLVVLAPKGNKKARRSETLRLYSGGKLGKTIHFEDEGDGLGYQEGRYNLYEIVYDGDKVSITYLHHGMESIYKTVILEVSGKEAVSFPFKAQ